MGNQSDFMRRVLKTGRRWGTVLLIALGIVILVRLVAYGTDFLISHELNQISGLSHQSLETNLFRCSFHIRDVRYVNTADGLDFQFESVLIEGVSLYSFFLNRHLEINDLCLKKPLLLFKNESVKKKQTKKSTENLPFSKISLHRIQLEGGYVHREQEDSSSVSFEWNALIDDLHAPLKVFSIDTLLKGMKLCASVHNLQWYPPDQSFHQCTTKISLNTDKGQLQGKDIFWDMSASKVNFFEKMTKVRSGMQWHIAQLNFEKLDFKKAIIQKTVEAEKLYLKGFIWRSMLKSYLPRPKSFRPLPMSQLRQSPVKFDIDSLIVEKGLIVYSEQADADNPPGQLFFSDFCLSGAGLKSDSILGLKASTRLMGQGKLEVDFAFPPDADDRYRISGSLGSMSIRTLNPMLNTTAHVDIRSGLLNHLYFDFQHDSSYAEGRLRMDYEDFKIDLIHSEKYHQKGLLLNVKTLIANSLIISTNNLDARNHRIGEIFFEREKNASILHFWWKSLFSGIQSSTGFKRPLKEI